MPDLSFITSLPPTAQALFIVILALSWGLVHFGVKAGQKNGGAAGPDAAQIVALTVDSRSIDRLAGEAAGLSVAITEMTAVGRDLVRAAEAQAGRTEGLTDELRETTREVRELTREVGKARP